LKATRALSNTATNTPLRFTFDSSISRQNQGMPRLLLRSLSHARLSLLVYRAVAASTSLLIGIIDSRG